jgi:hypothetical protein
MILKIAVVPMSGTKYEVTRDIDCMGMWQSGVMHGFKRSPEVVNASPPRLPPRSSERKERPAAVFDVDFAIRCSNLGQGTYPMVALFQRLRPNQAFRFVANTEGQSDSASPVFRRLISLAYNAGDHPQADVMLNVYHAHGKEVGQSDYMGSVQLRLSELVGVDRQEVTLALRNAQPEQQAMLRSLGSTLTLAVSSQRQGALKVRASPPSGVPSLSSVPAFSPGFHLTPPSGGQRAKGLNGRTGSNVATYGAFLTPVPAHRDVNMSGPPNSKVRSPGPTHAQHSARREIFLKQARLLVAGREFTKYSDRKHILGYGVNQRMVYYRRDKEYSRFGTLYWVDATKPAHTSSAPPAGISSASLDTLNTMHMGKHSKAFVTSKQGKAAPSNCCVTLIFAESLLHLQAESSKTRDAWVCGLRACLAKRSLSVQVLDAPEHLRRMWEEQDQEKAIMTPSANSREHSSIREYE